VQIIARVLEDKQEFNISSTLILNEFTSISANIGLSEHDRIALITAGHT